LESNADLDPTVTALYERVADLLGTEKAPVYLPSRTMCNEIAYRVRSLPPRRRDHSGLGGTIGQHPLGHPLGVDGKNSHGNRQFSLGTNPGPDYIYAPIRVFTELAHISATESVSPRPLSEVMYGMILSPGT
jgi:hypothetical protein